MIHISNLKAKHTTCQWKLGYRRGRIYAPMPTMHSWFWREGYKTQSAEVIANAYHACMTRNANLLLNLGPDKTGRIPDEAVETMHSVAKMIRS